jgi:dCMP deaminase
MRKPDWDTYFMTIALAVRARADCTGNRVGAILVQERFIVATGYNGTPSGAPNCSEGGCERCAHPERFPSGQGYDLCTCVHAEANALLMAARVGIRTQGSTIYTTMRPCFGCSVSLAQAGVRAHRLPARVAPPRPRLPRAYEALQARFEGGVTNAWSSTTPTPTGRCATGGSWSGRRDSNPRHTAWKAVALPAELLPPASSRPFVRCAVAACQA